MNNSVHRPNFKNRSDSFSKVNTGYPTAGVWTRYIIALKKINLFCYVKKNWKKELKMYNWKCIIENHDWKSSVVILILILKSVNDWKIIHTKINVFHIGINNYNSLHVRSIFSYVQKVFQVLILSLFLVVRSYHMGSFIIMELDKHYDNFVL